MNETKDIKLPLTFYKHAYTIEDADSKIVFDTSELSNSTAEHIVRCVNERDALIEVLEKLIKATERLPGAMYDVSDLNKAKEVLAKAKGETE